MRNRLVNLLFLIPSLAACAMGTANKKSIDDVTVGDFQITSVAYLSSYQNDIRVTYSGSVDPFNVEGHVYDRLEINETKSNWVHPNQDKKYFDAYAPNKNIELFLFDFYDENEELYISLSFNIKDSTTPSGPSDDPSGDDSGSTSGDDIVYPSGYNTLLWQDEFSGSSVDNSKWDYDIGTGNWGWGNGEMQYYRKENAILHNDTLHITARRESFGGSNFTSSRMVTRGKFSFKYGYLEARIKLPAKRAMWPAFWLLPENNVYGGWPYSGEIDVMEARGRVSNQSSSALHFTDNQGNHTYQTHAVSAGSIAEFHTYAVEWKQNAMNFFVDGSLHFTVTSDVWRTSKALDNPYAPFDQSFHIILNLAVGGQFDNWVEPDEDFTSADMIVDYVRVFQ